MSKRYTNVVDMVRDITEDDKFADELAAQIAERERLQAAARAWLIECFGFTVVNDGHGAFYFDENGEQHGLAANIDARLMEIYEGSQP